MKYDLIVIGGGPAGYVGAIRAAQLGKKVACIERDRAGGTCLNWGCIPTKSLLRNAELYSLLSRRAGDFGIKFDNLSFDWPKIISRSRSVANKLAGGVEFLFKKNKIDYLLGEGTIPQAGQVRYRSREGREETAETGKILISTGCIAKAMPSLDVNGTTVLDSHQAMIVENQPKRLIIIGAGAIGVEFAYFFNAFGTEVTLVEMLPNLLPVEDTEVSVALEKAFTRQGIKFLTNTKVVQAEAGENAVGLTVEGKKKQTLEGDAVLVAIGVSPVVPPGVELRRGKRWFPGN